MTCAMCWGVMLLCSEEGSDSMFIYLDVSVVVMGLIYIYMGPLLICVVYGADSILLWALGINKN